MYESSYEVLSGITENYKSNGADMEFYAGTVYLCSDGDVLVSPGGEPETFQSDSSGTDMPEDVGGAVSDFDISEFDYSDGAAGSDTVSVQDDGNQKIESEGNGNGFNEYFMVSSDCCGDLSSMLDCIVKIEDKLTVINDTVRGVSISVTTIIALMLIFWAERKIKHTVSRFTGGGRKND